MKFELDESKINPLVRASMLEAIRDARHAHYTNIQMRINGRDKVFEADWLKYLVPNITEPMESE